MKLTINIFFFICGLIVYWVFTDWLVETNYETLKEVWTTAYESGRKDGYELGKSEFKMTNDQINATCMFWNFEEEK